MSYGVSVQGVSVQGVSDRGVCVLGGKCPGGKCPGGKCPGGMCPWGKCPGGGGYMSGGGGVVLSPYRFIYLKLGKGYRSLLLSQTHVHLLIACLSPLGPVTFPAWPYHPAALGPILLYPIVSSV